MSSLAFAIPFDGDKLHHLLDHLDEHIHGDNVAETHEITTAKGLTHIRFYHQTTPQDMLVVYLEGPQLEQTLQQMHSEPGEHEEAWFQLMAAMGGAGKDEVGHLPSTLVMDWHHEAGHRHKPARRARAGHSA
jgi:hypothetical protein